MNTGVRSMQNNQTAIRTTGHNIANANTEGYSRQDVHTVAQKPIQKGSLLIGDGAQISRIRRSHDVFLTEQINKENQNIGLYKERSELLSNVENVFNETSEDAFSSTLSRMFNSFRQVSSNPENTALRTACTETVKAFANSTNKIANDLNRIQDNSNLKIDAVIQEINSIAKEIASLNQNIAKMEIHGSPSNDLRDKRDLLVKNLSKLIDIQTFEDTSAGGMLSVTVSGAASLVAGVKAHSVILDRTQNNSEGQANIVVKYDSSSFNITNAIKAGELKGMLEIRDLVVPDLRNKMEELIFALSKELNSIHSKAFDLNGSTGNALFTGVDAKKGILNSIKMATYLDDNPNKLALASRPFEPANNEAALEISSLQSKKILANNTATVADNFNSIVSTIGIKTKEANSLLKHQTGVLDQLNKFRDSISGVSLDEEAIDLVKYQKAFEASARVIKVADELLDTIINIRRM